MMDLGFDLTGLLSQTPSVVMLMLLYFQMMKKAEQQEAELKELHQMVSHIDRTLASADVEETKKKIQSVSQDQERLVTKVEALWNEFQKKKMNSY